MMHELGGGVGLAREARQKGRIAHPPGRDDLQGRISVEGQLASEIDCAHPTPAKLLDYLVTTES
jgi:hypothetical protein